MRRPPLRLSRITQDARQAGLGAQGGGAGLKGRCGPVSGCGRRRGAGLHGVPAGRGIRSAHQAAQADLGGTASDGGRWAKFAHLSF